MTTEAGALDESHEVATVERTLRVAERLARGLTGGTVVHLRGDLGAGKTQFAKGLARGLGLDPDDVVSPSFTLVHPHAPLDARGLGLVHVDLYRLEGPADLGELGLDELPGPTSIAAVEWPDRLGGTTLPADVVVTLTDLGGTRRRIEIVRLRRE